jgi:peptide/nickel transport system substrate-binding protein
MTSGHLCSAMPCIRSISMDMYWRQITRDRLGRRRMLAVTGGTALATIIFAACGGDNSRAKSDAAGLLSKPVDTLKQARRGGVLKDRAFADPSSLDFINFFNPLNAVGPLVFSTLFQFKPGYLRPAENEVAGDLIEAWERSPDGLQYTMKLRPGVKWHNKAPLNGRALDVEDVVFTWNRYSSQSSARAAIANSVDPSAPVESITALDTKTVVLKLAEPVVYGVGLFAAISGGQMVIMPKETGSTYDARSDMIGTGPFVLSNYSPSASFTFKRNPEYYDQDYALVDQVDMPIVPEYATTLSQFKAGNIFSFGSAATAPKINPDDVVSVKREEPRILVYQSDLRNATQARHLVFGWRPVGRSPFLDERVRQAVSMAVDRELYLETFHNISRFAADGLPVDTRWHTALPATTEGWWLDPKGKDFGPNAKYFKHDPAEAKRLLAAAGFPDGIRNVASNYVTGPELPTVKHAEVIDAMLKEIGLASTVRSLDYAKEYIPQYRNGRGQFEGWLYKATAGGFTAGDAAATLANEYWSKVGVTFHGFSTGTQNDQGGDPQVDALITKARLEPDTEKRRALVFDLQRDLAKKMYALPPPGSATGFDAAWPSLRNFRVYEGGRLNYRLWVDVTKPPLAKA